MEMEERQTKVEVLRRGTGERRRGSVQKLEMWRELIEEIKSHPGMWYQWWRRRKKRKKKKERRRRRKRRILAGKNVATIP
jgi:hypothetical protein